MTRLRVSGVTLLVAVVLLLVPALAWLQYRWVGQVSEAERERMQRTLRTAAAQFATAFDTELSRAVIGLQIEGAVARAENWTAYAERRQALSRRTSPFCRTALPRTQPRMAVGRDCWPSAAPETRGETP